MIFERKKAGKCLFGRSENKAQKAVSVFDSSAEGLCVRFSMAMRCAERPGMFGMLWQHEFYMVMEVTYGEYVYQALEFKVGSSLPPDELKGSTTKEKNGVWVRGVAYAPSLHVRKLKK